MPLKVVVARERCVLFSRFSFFSRDTAGLLRLVQRWTKDADKGKDKPIPWNFFFFQNAHVSFRKVRSGSGKIVSASSSSRYKIQNRSVAKLNEQRGRTERRDKDLSERRVSLFDAWSKMRVKVSERRSEKIVKLFGFNDISAASSSRSNEIRSNRGWKAIPFYETKNFPPLDIWSFFEQISNNSTRFSFRDKIDFFLLPISLFFNWALQWLRDRNKVERERRRQPCGKFACKCELTFFLKYSIR